MSGADLRRLLGGQTPDDLDKVLDAYLFDCRARGLRPATMDHYAWALRGSTVRAWRDLAGVRRLEDVDIAALLVHLRDRGLGPHTVDDYRRSWVNLMRWAVAAGYLDKPQAVKRGPMPQTSRRHLTDAEERALYDACVMTRDRVLLRFMIQTGLRLSEVAAVDVGDLVESAGGQWMVRVRGETSKGRRDRRVPLDTPGVTLSRELARYLAERPETRNPALWLSTRPTRRGEWERLSRHGICTVFRRLRQSTGIPVHPHMCRHTFATRALAAGVPERSLRQAGGWTNAASLDPYVHAQEQLMIDDWSRRRD